jgi:hypothetical protein
MAFAGPRKTLDEIRRELDVEFPSSVTSTLSACDVIELTVSQPVADRPKNESNQVLENRAVDAPRTTRRFRYVFAAVVGCVAGQLALLGFFAYRGSGVTRPTVAVGATVPSSVAATVPKSEESAAPDVGLAPPPVAPFTPPVALPAPVVADRPADRPVARRIAQRRAATPAAEPAEPERATDARVGVTESEDEVRAALSQWLATSSVGDGSIVPDTAVFLRADGKAARTYIPTKSGDDIIIREQLWRREANGWSIVEDREAWRSR